MKFIYIADNQRNKMAKKNISFFVTSFNKTALERKREGFGYFSIYKKRGELDLPRWRDWHQIGGVFTKIQSHRDGIS
ncbi:MAG: hypothetical protein DWQ02_24160 [Bacteroidetes bacterium]|nr:MAG: hypothetical protein DWQ02_24160 [Bacteroidota bacterium]